MTALELTPAAVIYIVYIVTTTGNIHMITATIYECTMNSSPFGQDTAPIQYSTWLARGITILLLVVFC